MTPQRRLMLFPSEPGTGDGYRLAVAADLARLAPGPEDVVVYRSAPHGSAEGNLRSLRTPSRLQQAWNILQGRPPSEFRPGQIRRCLEGLPLAFDEIFAGEVFFYRALRMLFPEHRIRVRTHNLFSLARSRQLHHRLPSSFRHAMNMQLYSRLEMEILSDPRVEMIFITEEERAFARLLRPGLAGPVWPVVEPGLTVPDAIRPPTAPRLVFFGSSAAAHTAIGLRILCREVFPRLRARVPGAEFHLFGHGSERYDRPKRGIFGHGRYAGEGLPFEGDGLFCIPDLHGCGIKLKVADLLRAGAPFIATPLGMTGYQIPPHPQILVRDLEAWAEAIQTYFEEHGLANLAVRPPGAG